MVHSFQKVEKKALCNQVAERIKEMIINGQFAPGDKLPNELELSEYMNVGRSSVREAIKILASMNIIQVIHGKGMFVCEELGTVDDPFGFCFLDSKELIHSIYEARMAIEPYAAKYAAQRRTETNLQKMETILNRFKEAIEYRSSNYLTEEKNFHIEVAKASLNYIFSKVIPVINEEFCEHYNSFLVNGVNFDGSALQALKSHMQIYELIKNRDAEGAFQAMYSHMQQAKTYIK